MQRPIKVLNVAEKNSIAKQVSAALSHNSARSQRGCSPYNPVFNFPYNINGQPCDMVFTSVAGHLMELDFPLEWKKWRGCSPIDLYGAPVLKRVPDDKKLIERNLQENSRGCQWLVLWLDCDREGENIAFEVIEVCRKANPRLVIKRAKFSALVARELERSVQTLGLPDEHASAAVDARQEIDLRIGASFTRFQTLLLQDKFKWQEGGIAEESRLISYGPCQFPTLGLIVQRQWEIRAHIAEPFWYIYVMYRTPEGQQCTFNWRRVHIYDHAIAAVMYETCVEAPTAKITKVDARQILKHPPVPLATLALQKEAITYLRMPGERMMKIAEELYQGGFISYPRTETDCFDPAYDLKALVRDHIQDQRWGQHAQRIDSGEMWHPPRSGGHDDKAHPPIHPTRWTAGADGWPLEKKRLYEFICRSFLASCSKAAVGYETNIEATIATETFHTRGLMVRERNWLEVYPWFRWGGNDNLPPFELNQTFMPTELLLKEGVTHPPSKLSERDLIIAMERHGIGTDATVADHIQKQLDRGYAVKDASALFSPSPLGEALIAGYHKMGLSNLWQPNLRGVIEHNISEVARGRRAKGDVLEEAVQHFRSDYVSAAQKQGVMVEEVGRFFAPWDGDPAQPQQAAPPGEAIGPCPACSAPFKLCKPEQGVPYLSCSTAPLCRKAVYLPMAIGQADVSDQQCTQCPGIVRKVAMKLRRAALPYGFDAEMTCCVLCDRRFQDLCETGGTARPAAQSRASDRGGRGAGGQRAGGWAGRQHPTSGQAATRAGGQAGRALQYDARELFPNDKSLRLATGGQRAAGRAGGRHPTAGRAPAGAGGQAGRAAARRGSGSWGRGGRRDGAADMGRGAPRSRRRERDSDHELDDNYPAMNRRGRARTGPRGGGRARTPQRARGAWNGPRSPDRFQAGMSRQPVQGGHFVSATGHTAGNGGAAGACFKCGQPGHWSNACPNQ